MDTRLVLLIDVQNFVEDYQKENYLSLLPMDDDNYQHIQDAYQILPYYVDGTYIQHK
jgi:hypothetical protein